MKKYGPYPVDKEKKLARERRFHERHPERAKEYAKRRYAKNRDEILAKARALAARPDQVARKKAYYAENRDKIIAQISKWQRDNKEAVNAKNAAWRAENIDKVRAQIAARRAVNMPAIRERSRAWKAANTGIVSAATAERRARQKMARPAWADSGAMRLVYQEARSVSALTGVEHEVDHIIPLQSKKVCGLHWEGNLQILTALENQRKCNKLEVSQWAM